MTMSEGSGGLDDVLGEYLEELEHQRRGARTRILTKHPQFASQLRSFFGNYDHFEAQTESMRAHSTHTELLGRTIGGYELRRVVGYGAMGVVYEAWQPKLKRRVALKVLPQELLPRERLVDRFDREARLAASLSHPNVCPIHEFGRDEGYRFIAMQFVDGQTLTERIEWSDKVGRRCCAVSPAGSAESDVTSRDDNGSKDVLEILTLFSKLCEALHFIHEHGVVHRDVKPGNIMLGASGEPVIVDFGLAREERIQASSLTESGAIVGTLSYMSPEQIQGKTIDRRTDVYSLGVTLFECLTLRKPFEGETRHELYQQILFSDAPDCRQVNRHVPKDLGVVVQKAMEKEPQRRYPDAHEFAEDVRRVIAHEPVRARAAGPLLRARRWSQRHPALATLEACLLLTLVGSLFFIYALFRHRDALERAHVESLTVADSESFPKVLSKLHSEGVLAGLERELRARLHEHTADSRAKLNLALASSVVDESWYDYVLERSRSASPQEARAIAEVAARHGIPLEERLEQTVRTHEEAPDVRLRAFAIASRMAPGESLFRWIPGLSTWLCEETRFEAERWLAEFPGEVRARLEKEYEKQVSRGDHGFARWALIVLRNDDLDYLVESLLDGRDSALRKAVDALERHGPDAIRAIRKRFTGTYPRTAPEDRKDRLASRQANLAAALLRIGPEEAEDVWSLLEHSEDPRLRSFLIVRLSMAGVSPELLASRLEREPEPSVRRAIVLALGEYAATSFSEAGRTRLIGTLKRVFVEDPDPGVHLAALWTVSKLEGPGVARTMERELAASRDFAGKQWHHGANGHCMVEIEGRADFVMGSPHGEEGRSETEVQRPGALPRRYLLSAREVSWAQFAPFHRARHEEAKEWMRRSGEEAGRSEDPWEKAKRRYYSTFASELDPEFVKSEEHPATVNWHSAIFYCLWLSEREGIAEDDWCYEIREVSQDMVVWKLKEDYLCKSGYRLPTAAEWEYACRAGAITRRPYGNTDSLLGEYAWFLDNSAFEPQPRSRLKPNDFGLFDMLGNIEEYCESDLREVDQALREKEPALYAREYELAHRFRVPQLYVEARGGSVHTAAGHLRPSYAEFVELDERRLLVGFRLARTVAR